MEERIERLLSMLMPFMACDDCPMREECDEHYGNITPPESACRELIRCYINDEPAPEPVEQDYDVVVRWVGSKTYTIRAKNEEEALTIARDNACIGDVDDWDYEAVDWERR